MKAEFDKEIDALLRRSLRAAGRGARAPRDATATPHLDADELSAFAENALPAAARLGAISHLADCDQCRGAAVILSRAAGEPEKLAAVPASADARGAAASGGWLAALFSPRLLRFVAPALALCLVGAVAFVLLRTRRDAGSVAQHTAAPEAVRPGITGGVGDSANAGANMNTSTGTTANTAANVAQPPSDSDQTPRQDRPAPSGPGAEPEAPDGSDARTQGELARQQPAEAAATEAAAPPPPPRPVAAESQPTTPAPSAAARDAAKEKKEDNRKVADDETARVDEGQQERRVNQIGNLDTQQSPDGSRARSGNYGGARNVPAAPRREADRSSRSVTVPRPGDAAGAGTSREEAKSSGETREAAGHRFRRAGNAWVDVKYRPSMDMTGVRRGTDQFRALVADFPLLGRIAEQLSGEVITVINGRAYRIR
jgi:hypothetical protein